jgi:ArsR family transcriptional regulator
MDQLVTTLKAVSDEARLRILNLLIHRGELCVCDIEAVMGFTQTKVSRHLAYLRRAQLVHARRKGLWMLYTIASPRTAGQKEALAFLARILNEHPVARKDLRTLDARMQKGCCAASTLTDGTLTAVVSTLYTS